MRHACRGMTNVQTMGMREYVKTKSESNKEAVCDAVIALENPTVDEIKKFLDSRAKETVKRDFEESEFSSKLLRKKEEENTISKRTIERKLNELIKEGKVERNINNRYTVITKGILTDFDFLASFYSRTIFGKVVSNFPWHNKKEEFEQRFVQMVNVFGAFMVYVFIHSLEPPSTNNYQSGKNDNLVLIEAKKKLAKLSRSDREYYRRRWIARAIDPYFMSCYFAGFIGLIDLKRREEFANKTGRPDMDLTPDFELSRRNYEGLMDLFKQKYPSAYNIIKQNENELFREDSVIFQYLKTI
jgi:uncharacterized protein YsxB (DUF464 family)